MEAYLCWARQQCVQHACTCDSAFLILPACLCCSFGHGTLDILNSTHALW
jgi:hypothetical protein